MIEKWRAPSIIRKPIRRQLWSTTARLTLQLSSSALATPAASILRLASWVSRWVETKSGMNLSRQSARRGREQLVDRDRLRNNALLHGVPDELIEHPPVGCNAIRERLAGDLHHPLVHLVDGGGLLDLAGLEPLDIEPLRFREGIEHIGGEVGVLGDQLVLDHHRVVDRVVAVAAQRCEPGVERIGNERLHVLMIDLD